MSKETAAWYVTVAVRDAVVGRTVVGRDAGNLYPNSGFYREKVEIPSHAVRKSLPKQRKSRERYRKQQHNKNEKENCLWQK